MINNLTNALRAFMKRYPASTSADMQTFILGYQACLEDNGVKFVEASNNDKEEEDYNYLASGRDHFDGV